MLDTEYLDITSNSTDVLEDLRSSPVEYIISEEQYYVQKPIYDVLKRILDVVLSLAALIILFPFLLITVFIIMLDDHSGSPIFSQERCGKGGKVFRIYKFRTMCCDAEEKLESFQKYNEMDGPVFKIKDDPRVTRVGRFLRAAGIDELPQLWNIIKGDMSLVGPRPALPSEVAQYGDKEKVRLLILPGLTCYWQIEPNRNSVSFEDWMELDRKYVADRSLLVDIKIIFKTFLTVIKMQGC